MEVNINTSLVVANTTSSKVSANVSSSKVYANTYTPTIPANSSTISIVSALPTTGQAIATTDKPKVEVNILGIDSKSIYLTPEIFARYKEILNISDSVNIIKGVLREYLSNTTIDFSKLLDISKIQSSTYIATDTTIKQQYKPFDDTYIATDTYISVFDANRSVVETQSTSSSKYFDAGKVNISLPTLLDTYTNIFQAYRDITSNSTTISNNIKDTSKYLQFNSNIADTYTSTITFIREYTDNVLSISAPTLSYVKDNTSLVSNTDIFSKITDTNLTPASNFTGISTINKNIDMQGASSSLLSDTYFNTVQFIRSYSSISNSTDSDYLEIGKNNLSSFTNTDQNTLSLDTVYSSSYSTSFTLDLLNTFNRSLLSMASITDDNLGEAVLDDDQYALVYKTALSIFASSDTYTISTEYIKSYLDNSTFTDLDDLAIGKVNISIGITESTLSNIVSFLRDIASNYTSISINEKTLNKPVSSVYAISDLIDASKGFVRSTESNYLSSDSDAFDILKPFSSNFSTAFVYSNAVNPTKVSTSTLAENKDAFMTSYFASDYTPVGYVGQVYAI